MAPRLIGRIKSILQDNLSEFLEDSDGAAGSQPAYPSKTGFSDRIRSELGSAIARRYRLKKQLGDLPDFEPGMIAEAERAIDVGDDAEAKAILRRKTEAKGAVEALQDEIADLDAEVELLEALLAALASDALTADQVLDRLTRFENQVETKNNQKDES